MKVTTLIAGTTLALLATSATPSPASAQHALTMADYAGRTCVGTM